MTANLLPIYCAAMATIAALSFFARHNRKSGWKKPRRGFVDALTYLEARPDVLAEQQIPILEPVTAKDAAGFSSQLLQLRGALGTARELVHR